MRKVINLENKTNKKILTSFRVLSSWLHAWLSSAEDAKKKSVSNEVFVSKDTDSVCLHYQIHIIVFGHGHAQAESSIPGTKQDTNPSPSQ